MSVLSPSNLETTDYGTQGWNAVHSANMQKINQKLGVLMSSSTTPGSQTVTDPAALTAQALTDSTSGTPSQTVNDVGAVFDQTTLNNNFASLVDEVNKLRADNVELRTILVALLVELRKTTGCGVLGG